MTAGDGFSTPPDDAPGWLALVRDDLLDLDPEEFRAAWGVD